MNKDRATQYVRSEHRDVTLLNTADHGAVLFEQSGSLYTSRENQIRTMSGSDEQAGTDSFWEDVPADNAEISTTVFVAVGVLVAFSLDIIGFELAVIAMPGLIAAASATE